MKWLVRSLMPGLLCVSVVGARPANPGVAQDVDSPPAAATLRDIARTPAGDPQLRIHVNGHTAVVRALAFTPDSARLCTAGLDKVVQVWNLRAAPRDLQGAPLPQRTVRWQVARGLRGSIQALACAPGDGTLALGGYGATGHVGEILLVDPVQGSLMHVLQGHLQPIASLAFSADGNWLASVDIEGRAILWKRGQWKPQVVDPPDATAYGVEPARTIAQQPKLRPLAMIGNSRLLLPTYAQTDAQGRPQWKLRQVKLDDPRDARTLDPLHQGVVTALAAVPDGSRAASADLAGRLFLHDLRSAQVFTLSPGAVVLSLAFTPDGRRLAVGTASTRGKPAQLQLWDVEARRMIRQSPAADHVHACAISGDGTKLAYVGGKTYEVAVESLADSRRLLTLGGVSRRVLKAAFARNEPYYRVAFGGEPRVRGRYDLAELEQSFDAERLQLDRERLNPAEWLAVDWCRGDWDARPQRGHLQLFRAGKPMGRAVFDTALEEGAVRSYCWIPDAQGKPFAIAVGTDLQNSVYVFQLAEQGTCRILRHFRGHNDYVASLGVSRDGKYLVSGSADGTIGIWSLAGLAQGKASRFGASLAAAGELTVRTIDPAGPLYFKGVRAGDTIREIVWYADREGRNLRTENSPGKMLAALDALPWGVQVQFAVARGGAARPGFLLLPAWQPLASLFVGANHEWAYWTPEGYYDASINGHRLFGWQVNRGLERLPAFYRADQFRQKLEQPAVLERLLPAGSLKEAFDAARVSPRGELDRAVPEQIAATPAVEILRPRSGGELGQASAQVAVRIDVPSGVKLLRTRAYANGVVAPAGKRIDEKSQGRRVVQTYQWDVPLPADETNLIQVIAATEGGVTGLDEIQVRRLKPARPARPKMHIRALAVDRYADPGVPPLSFSVVDAKAVMDALRLRANDLYQIESARLLANDEATPEKWRACLRELAAQCKGNTGPDDLIVVFLAGHGWADAATGRYYYIGPRFQMANLGKSYSECVAWTDFAPVGDIPCRKLVLLDTCHSGAIQPLRARNMKTAVRQLQDDVLLTLAASQGQQQAAEFRAWKHGVFTKCVLDALEGQGERADPRRVFLGDVIQYVGNTVPRLTSELTHGTAQQPAAAPDDLLAFIRLPLSSVAGPRPGPSPPAGK